MIITNTCVEGVGHEGGVVRELLLPPENTLDHQLHVVRPLPHLSKLNFQLAKVNLHSQLSESIKSTFPLVGKVNSATGQLAKVDV